MKKLLGGLAISMMAVSIANASDYQFDVDGWVANTDIDGAGDDTDVGLGIEFHFLPVDTSQGPLAEAAFITQSSNIYARQIRSGSGGLDFDITVIGGEVYIPDTMFYLGLDYAYDNDDSSNSNWTLHAGVTPIENLLVTTSYNEDGDYEPNIRAKYLLALDNGATLGFRGNAVDHENGGNTISGGMDYYFNRYTNVGFTLTDFDDFQTSEVHVRHFFLEDAYAGLSYSENDFADTIALSGGFRF